MVDEIDYFPTGFPALYRGLTPALIAQIPSGAAFYGTYDALRIFSLHHRSVDRKGHGDELTILETLIFGAIAGAVAETVTYPLEVCLAFLCIVGAQDYQGDHIQLNWTATSTLNKQVLRRSMQVDKFADMPNDVFKVRKVAIDIIRKQGIRGLYMGLLPSVMQVLPSSALGYLTYELTKKAYLNWEEKLKNGERCDRS